MAFPGAAGGELGEEGDVHVRDHVVADSAVAAITQMVFGNEVLGVKVPFGSIGRGMFAETPYLRQGKLVVPVDDRCDRLVQLVFGDVPLVDEGSRAVASSRSQTSN